MGTKELSEKAKNLKEPLKQPYWFITSAMTVESEMYLGTKADRRKLETRNFFSSKEQAEKYLAKIVKFLQEKNP